MWNDLPSELRNSDISRECLTCRLESLLFQRAYLGASENCSRGAIKMYYLIDSSIDRLNIVYKCQMWCFTTDCLVAYDTIRYVPKKY